MGFLGPVGEPIRSLASMLGIWVRSPVTSWDTTPGHWSGQQKAAQQIQQDVMLKFVDQLPNILTDERFIDAAAEFAVKVEIMSRPQIAEGEDEFELPN